MKFVINGGKKLSGEIRVAGMKNATTPIIAATLLTSEPCVLDNVPRIADVNKMLGILESIGSKVSWTGEHQVTIHNDEVKPETLDKKLVKSLRSSVLFLGPFLARFKSIEMSEPGGCIIGSRPLDTHFQSMEKLGAEIECENGTYRVSRETLRGTTIVLLEASVTATENVVMAACFAEGVTVIKNAACEPHVQELVEFLNSMGAKIEGAGTSTLVVQGIESLHGTHHVLYPDTIEAGTFIVLGLATKSAITVQGVVPSHMDVVLERLKSMGAELEIGEDYVKVLPTSQLVGAGKIDARPYPGIPTDLQALFGVLATQSRGTTLIHDTLFEGRMGYIGELVKMGANATVCDPHRVIIHGPTPLYGQEIRSFDLRAGATMIIAGLLASGQTVINEAEIVDRGYERIEERLRGLGADISRID